MSDPIRKWYEWSIRHQDVNLWTSRSLLPMIPILIAAFGLIYAGYQLIGTLLLLIPLGWIFCMMLLSASDFIQPIVRYFRSEK